MRIAFFGLTITSSWGNGHATTYRSLLRALHGRGHELVFFEKNLDWYRNNRDLHEAPYTAIRTYDQWDDVRVEAQRAMHECDAVIVGSYFPDAAAVLRELPGCGSALLCFYDIDTPVTLEALRGRRCEYLALEHLPALDLYLSFTGGPALAGIEELGARRARPLYCSADPEIYYPRGAGEPRRFANDLGYMGTFSDDRQPKVERLLLQPARRAPHRRFVIAGPKFPRIARWPANVWNVYHLSPREHRVFYLSCRATLNITRKAMVAAGYSPSVRLFEAAACGAAILSDGWPGIDDFFQPGREILIVDSPRDVLRALDRSDAELATIAEAATARVLSNHTSAHRAAELERYLEECRACASPTGASGRAMLAGTRDLQSPSDRVSHLARPA
jgi:spore maturation protein CgeB